MLGGTGQDYPGLRRGRRDTRQDQGIDPLIRSLGAVVQCGPSRNTNFRSRVFAPAAASVGLAGLTPHDLRHTAASLSVAAGANVQAVQRMLGHASASMTLERVRGPVR
ncbi:tyrosine-type recombinase/integrase [Micromonospora chersina]|uniref:tyrosine-type recombinase/integrase n=1 Tax=Micromonospora chersina TaxID=47854 RepID=UPI0037A32E18